MKFQKEWFKSGIKAWPYALLEIIVFSFLLYAMKYDYISNGYTQITYSLTLIFLTYLSITFTNLFYKQVIKDMKRKGGF